MQARMPPQSMLRVSGVPARSDTSQTAFFEENSMSFRSLSLAAVAASVLSTGAWAGQAAQGAAQQQQPAAPPTRAAILQNVDARFTVLDANKDGSVVAAEIQAAQTRAIQQFTAMQKQRLEADFKRLDTSKDNQLSLAEFSAVASPPRPSGTPAEAVAQVDTNKDGKVSQAEYRAPALANFDRADANKDGTLSEQETRALMQR